MDWRKRRKLLGFGGYDPGTWAGAGLVPGSTILERSTELATITERCRELPPSLPLHAILPWDETEHEKMMPFFN